MHPDTLKFYKYVPIKKPIYRGKFCWQPFGILQIDNDGDVQLCGCQLHMPYTIGNIYQNSLQEIWLGSSAEQVRQAVIDEDFTYCNWACSSLPVLPPRPPVLPTVPDFPEHIKIDLDLSCNLKCPSCREETIIEKNTDKIKKQEKIFEEIRQWAKDHPHRSIMVSPMASGEIFASHSGLKFLKSLSDGQTPNLELTITTNGTLVNRNQNLLSQIKNLLHEFSISIDAATAETYALVRGGDWEELQRGLQFLHQQLHIPINLNFCIQQHNWHEIEQFADYAAQFDANVRYQKIEDWGHWTIAWWHDHNVFDRNKPTFDLALQSLARVKRKYPERISLAAKLTKYLEKLDL